MAVHVAVVHVPVGQKGPVAGRQVDVNVDVEAGTHGCPSVVSSATSPCDPGWCPLVTGNPCPPVVVVIVPSAVVEGSPSPGIVGDPGVAVVGHHPVAVRGIGVEVSPHVGNPYPTVSTVVDPSAVRPQLVVEDIEADTPVVVLIIFVVVALSIVVVVVISSLCVSAAGSVA